MMTRQRFREDTAGTLEFYPPENQVASAATLTIYKPAGSGSVLQSSTNATIDTVDTTISANASKGARNVTLASAADVTAGVQYLLEQNGRVQPVEVRSVSGTTAYLVNKLHFDFTSGATFKGYRLSYSLTATHTADVDRNYFAEFSYTIASAAYYAIVPFDVVEATDWYPTTLADVYARHPRAAWLLDDHDLDGYEALRVTWEQMLVPSLAAGGMHIERVRDYYHLVPLHVAFISEWLAEHAAMVDPDAIAQLELAKSRRQEIEAAVTSDVPWYDSDDDKSADAGEENRVKSFVEVLR